MREAARVVLKERVMAVIKGGNAEHVLFWVFSVLAVQTVFMGQWCGQHGCNQTGRNPRFLVTGYTVDMDVLLREWAKLHSNEPLEIAGS